MPIYEYSCSNCGHKFELLQKVQEEPEKICPACGKSDAQRLVSAAQFALKGSGWYKTDYAPNKKSETSPAKPKSDTSP